MKKWYVVRKCSQKSKQGHFLPASASLLVENIFTSKLKHIWIFYITFFFTLQEVTQKFHGKRQTKAKLARINVLIDIISSSIGELSRAVGINIQDCSCNNSFSVRGKTKEKSHLTLFLTFHDLQCWHRSILNSLWPSLGYWLNSIQ